MQAIWQFIQEFWELIFGAGGLVSMTLYYNQTKRVKKAEATASEIVNLNKIIERLETEIKRLELKQESLENRINDKDKLVSTLYREIEEKDKKYSIKKRAINCAFECKNHSNECPVLKRLAELEK
ncbi:hypothetical protein LJC11_03065 [Bacteroidales bacterium OttesenSCG-928-I21]|nr:hypothetical protein [Bacteroidales bacterium OttesenSCG-928-I21]